MARGPYRKKKRTHVPQDESQRKRDAKSFVFWRGRHGVVLKQLETDLRKLLAPNTATHLKESRRNQLKDFVHVAGPLGVTQFIILTATEHAAYLRLAKTPRGPTCTMRLHAYSLMRDVMAASSRPAHPDTTWAAAPLVVLNNFAAGGGPLSLLATMFQSVFPSINVQSTQLRACKRVVLLSYDASSQRISFRHYSIGTAPSGVTKGVKALVGGRNMPNLGEMRDVSELLTRSGYGSESEGEEAAESRVTLAQSMGRGNIADRQSRVKLQEIGPRMELELIKAEEGLCTGKVLFHALVSKDAEAEQEKQVAIDIAEASAAERERVRAARRHQQEENVRRKAAKKSKTGPEDTSKGKERRGKPKSQEWWAKPAVDAQPMQADDDAAYYREEVGTEPDEDFKAKRQKRDHNPKQRGSADQGHRHSGRNADTKQTAGKKRGKRRS